MKVEAIKAEVIPQICQVFVKAYQDCVLVEGQIDLAFHCLKMFSGLVINGQNALIDEQCRKLKES